jgi:hypothetical protein
MFRLSSWGTESFGHSRFTKQNSRIQKREKVTEGGKGGG